jgi:hypothetical protein
MLTPAGRRLAERATIAVNDAVFSHPGLDPDGVAELVDVLQRLRRGAGDFA